MSPYVKNPRCMKFGCARNRVAVPHLSRGVPGCANIFPRRLVVCEYWHTRNTEISISLRERHFRKRENRYVSSIEGLKLGCSGCATPAKPQDVGRKNWNTRGVGWNVPPVPSTSEVIL